MAHPKTIEAFDAIGEDWKNRHQKGHEKTVAAQKELIETDTKKVTKVHNVYRLRVDDDNGISQQYITWDQTTTGHTEIGNEVSYYEDAKDLAMWYEPIPKKEIKYNPDTQRQEVVTKLEDISNVITHYIYPFNKENIAMIEKITKNNRNKCNFYVRDLYGKTRKCDGFESWPTKQFNTLIEFRNTGTLDERLAALQHHQYH